MPFNRRKNPWLYNNFLDSCAFNPSYSPEDSASKELFDRSEENVKLILLITHSVQKEIDHPGTPDWVKEKARCQLHNLQFQLTREEMDLIKKIHYMLTGEGNPEKYAADARHVFYAQRDGSFFITTDKRILKKAKELKKICMVEILLPSEFLELLDYWGA